MRFYMTHGFRRYLRKRLLRLTRLAGLATAWSFPLVATSTFLSDLAGGRWSPWAGAAAIYAVALAGWMTTDELAPPPEPCRWR